MKLDFLSCIFGNQPSCLMFVLVVHGNYSDWVYADCSVSCYTWDVSGTRYGGFVNRTRNCTNPAPQYGGTTAPLLATLLRRCRAGRKMEMPVQMEVSPSHYNAISDSLWHFSYKFIYTTHKRRSCRGRAVRASDFHTGGPRFEPRPGSSALGQGALSSLPSLSEETLSRWSRV